MGELECHGIPCPGPGKMLNLLRGKFVGISKMIIESKDMNMNPSFGVMDPGMSWKSSLKSFDLAMAVGRQQQKGLPRNILFVRPTSRVQFKAVRLTFYVTVVYSNSIEPPRALHHAVLLNSFRVTMKMVLDTVLTQV